MHALFKGKPLGRAYLLDFVVEGIVAVEAKSVEATLPIHVAQSVTYVRVTGLPAGLLINFNVKRLVDGVRRIVNDRPHPRFRQPTVEQVHVDTEGFGTNLEEEP